MAKNTDNNDNHAYGLIILNTTRRCLIDSISDTTGISSAIMDNTVYLVEINESLNKTDSADKEFYDGTCITEDTDNVWTAT